MFNFWIRHLSLLSVLTLSSVLHFYDLHSKRPSILFPVVGRASFVHKLLLVHSQLLIPYLLTWLNMARIYGLNCFNTNTLRYIFKLRNCRNIALRSP